MTITANLFVRQYYLMVLKKGENLFLSRNVNNNFSEISLKWHKRYAKFYIGVVYRG